MTEEEAKTKWCPQSRYAFANGATGNRGGGQADDAYPPLVSATRCQGSACMAWRWLPSFSVSGKEIQGSTKGYCGLAGEP